MKKRLIYFVCFLVLVVSFIDCKSNSNKDRQAKMESVSSVENITIDLDKNIQLPYDSLVAKVEFIKLETRDDNIIGEITQLLFVDSVIVVVDREKAKSVLVFNMKGQFKCKVGGIGNGPEEFVEISNVIITPDKHQICILDRPQKKILYFDLNGGFISATRQPFTLNTFEYIDGGHKVFDVTAMFDNAYGPNRGNALLVTDSTDNILYGAFNDIYRSNFTWGYASPLRKFNDHVYFTPTLTDSIFQIEKDRVIPKYYIDIKTNGMPEFSRKKITAEQFNEYTKRYFFFNGDFIELEDFTFVNIATPVGYPFAIYSHLKKKTFLTTGMFTNPLYTFFKYEPIAGYKDNGVVYVVDGYNVYSLKKELYKLKNYKPLLDEFYKGINENSNPILLIYYLNKRM